MAVFQQYRQTANCRTGSIESEDGEGGREGVILKFEVNGKTVTYLQAVYQSCEVVLLTHRFPKKVKLVGGRRDNGE